MMKQVVKGVEDILTQIGSVAFEWVAYNRERKHFAQSAHHTANLGKGTLTSNMVMVLTIGGKVKIK